MANERLDFIRKHIGQPIAGSPSAITNWLAGVPRVVEPGTLVIEYTVRKDMTNMMGVLHGGVSATMLDDVCGICCLISAEDHFFATVNLSIDYLSGSQPGDVLTATATIVRQGKTIINVQADLKKQDGKIVAKCTSNLINTPIKLT